MVNYGWDEHISYSDAKAATAVLVAPAVGDDPDGRLPSEGPTGASLAAPAVPLDMPEGLTAAEQRLWQTLSRVRHGRCVDCGRWDGRRFGHECAKGLNCSERRWTGHTGPKAYRTIPPSDPQFLGFCSQFVDSAGAD